MHKSFTYLITLFFFGALSAQPYVRWDFEASALTPSLGTGSIATVGDVTTSFAAGDNASLAALNITGYPAAGTASASAGIEFRVNTFHHAGIIIAWASRNSATASKYVQFQVSGDGGATWAVADLTPANTTGSEGTVDYDNDVFGNPQDGEWYNHVIDLANVAAANNRPNFRFRILAVFAPGTTDYAPTKDGDTYSTSGTIRFDDVTIASNSDLPLMLTSFNLISNENGISLNWSTANEVDVKQINVEKSFDGTHFSDIASVAAKNHSINNYSYQDAKLLAPVAFYRLNMIDKNNSSYLSAVISAKNNEAVKLIIYPNPVSSQLVMLHPKAIAGASINVISIDGKKLISYNVPVDALQSTLNISRLGSGNYFAVYRDGHTKTEAAKFSKK